MKLKIEHKNIFGKKLAEAVKSVLVYNLTLKEVEDHLKTDDRFNRFVIGHGGSHVWISCKNGKRVAIIAETESDIPRNTQPVAPVSGFIATWKAQYMRTAPAFTGLN